MSSPDYGKLEERIAQLERQYLDLDQAIKELKSKITTLKEVMTELTDMYDQHIHGKWTLEEIKIALQNIQELVSLLQSSGMLSSGPEGQSAFLQKMLFEEYLKSKQGAMPSEGVPVKPLSRKESSKLRKIFQESEKEKGEEGEEEDEEDEE